MNKNEIVTVMLPEGVSRKQFRMRSQFGRDQVAAAAGSLGWDSFERPFPTYFLECARVLKGAVFDVGANTGFYTLLAASASRSNKVFSFEPDQEILQCLRDNAELSGVSRQVRAFPLALSDKSGTATLFVPTQEHGLVETSSSLEQDFKPRHSQRREVETETLDGFVARHHDNKGISIIKIDVEGHEPSVLAGAENTINSKRPILFVEVLGRADLEFFSGFIKRHHYVDVPLRESGIAAANGGVEFFEDGWNHAFLPKEKAEVFLSLSSG